MPTSKTTPNLSSAPPKEPIRAGDMPTISGSDREKEINRNLEEMSLGLSHLTSLAKDMQVELDRQNPLIERITDKTEKTYGRIESQNAQIKRIK